MSLASDPRLDPLLLLGLSTLIVLSPLAVGGAEPWAYSGIEVVAFLLIMIWTARLSATGYHVRALFNPQRRVVTIPLLLFAVLIAVQVAPLPPGLERSVSPAAYRLYREVFARPANAPLPAAVSPPVIPQVQRRSPIILPSEEEVNAGTAIPFIPAQPLSPSVRVGKAQGWSYFHDRVWPYIDYRSFSLTLDRQLTAEACLETFAYVGLFALLLTYPFESRNSETIFIHRLILTVLITGGLVAFIGMLERADSNGKVLWVFQPWDWMNGWLTGRAYGSFANPDHFAAYLSLVLPLAIVGMLSPESMATEANQTFCRFFCAATGIVITCGLLLSSSRGGWVSALIGFSWIAMFWRPDPASANLIARPWRLWFLGGLALILAGGLIGEAGRGQVEARVQQTLRQRLLDRQATALNSLRMVGDFPIAGVGLGSWSVIYPHYQLPPFSMTYVNAVHNDYVQLAAETGLVGFALLVGALLAALTVMMRRLGRLATGPRALVVAMTGGLLGLAAHEFFDFPLHIPAIALLASVYLGLAMRLSEPKSIPLLRSARPTAIWPRALAVTAVAVLILLALTQPMVPYPYDVLWWMPLSGAQAQIAAHPMSYQAHVVLALALENSPRRTQELRTAMDLYPVHPLARDLYARDLAQRGDLTQAMAQLRRSMCLAPDRDGHFYLFRDRLTGWLSPAEKQAVEQGLRCGLDRGYAGAGQWLAEFDAEDGRFDEAGQAYLAGAARESNLKTRSYLMVRGGMVFAQGGDLAQARRAIAGAIALQPADKWAYEQMVERVLIPARDIQGVRALVAKGLQDGADPADLYSLLAEAEQSQANYSQAESALTKALAAQPDDFDTLHSLGLLDLRQDRFGSAANWLRKAVQIRPDSVATLFQLGQAEVLAYDYYRAERDLRRAVAMAPNDREIAAYYRNFQRKMASDDSPQATGSANAGSAADDPGASESP